MKQYLTVPVLGAVLFVLTLSSLVIGVKSIPIDQLGHLSESQLHILLSSRLPRTISLIVAGAGLSICGLLMQQLTQNRFVSPTTAGTMEWAKLGIVLTLIFFQGASLIVQLAFAILFTILGTLFFILILKAITFQDQAFIPLIGLLLGQVVGAFTLFLGLWFQVLQSVTSWLQGNFALVTSHRYELLFLAVPCLIAIYVFSYHFTIVGLGETFAHNLGIAYQRVILFGLILVAIVTATIVIIVGSIPFLGLIVPNVIRLSKGDYLASHLGLTALLGAVTLMFCDLVGRLIIFPYDIPIGLTLGVLGSLFFLRLMTQSEVSRG